LRGAAAFDGPETRRCSLPTGKSSQAHGRKDGRQGMLRTQNDDSSRHPPQAADPQVQSASTRCSRGSTTARDDSPGAFCQAVSLSAESLACHWQSASTARKRPTPSVRPHQISWTGDECNPRLATSLAFRGHHAAAAEGNLEYPAWFFFSALCRHSRSPRIGRKAWGWEHNIFESGVWHEKVTQQRECEGSGAGVQNDELDCQRERDARRESPEDSAALDIGFAQHHLDGPSPWYPGRTLRTHCDGQLSLQLESLDRHVDLHGRGAPANAQATARFRVGTLHVCDPARNQPLTCLQPGPANRVYDAVPVCWRAPSPHLLVEPCPTIPDFLRPKEGREGHRAFLRQQHGH
jgi:hypothetical protein